MALIIKIFAYILFNHRLEAFSRITFSCPELNHIHPIMQAIRHESIMEDDVVFSVRTMPNEKTCTERQLFHIDGHDVYAYFGMIQTASAKVDRPPLSITASLYFDFEPTLDYGFAYRLWQTAYHFIRFLCYRNNISLPVATLHSLYKDDLYPKCAELRVVANKEETETYPLETDRCIKQAFIAGSEGKILSDIAQNTIYVEWIVYAVQLRYYEVSDRNIQQAINSLFHLNRLMLGE